MGLLRFLIKTTHNLPDPIARAAQQRAYGDGPAHSRQRNEFRKDWEQYLEASYPTYFEQGGITEYTGETEPRRFGKR